jgi:hypothetical protein
VYFYELHEGDDDLFHDLLLVHETRIEPEDFFEMVREIRERLVGDYETETLIEAIAVELERDHGFEAVWDDRLTAAVNVSREAEDTFLAEVDGEDDEVDGGGGFRTVYAKLTPDPDD